MTADRALAELAARQHRVFSVGQAKGIGIPSTTLARWAARGRVVQLGPSTYAIAGSPITWEARLMALTLQTGGAASHRSAARLHGPDNFRHSSSLEVTVPHGRGQRIAYGQVHQSRAPELMATTVIDNIPCVGAARLLVDLAAVLPLFRLGRAVDDLRRSRRAEDDAILEAFVLHKRRGRPGMTKLRAALEDQLGTEVNDSTFEYLVLALFKDAGLAAPVVHLRISDPDGVFIAEVDLAYPELKVAIELDSKAYHLNSVSFERDPLKRNRLKEVGWYVIPITWRMLKDDPAGVIRSVERALAFQEKVLRALGELP